MQQELTGSYVRELAIDDVSLPGLVELGLQQLCSQVEYIQLACTSDIQCESLKHLEGFCSIRILHFIPYR